jgi:hypothetical protein
VRVHRSIEALENQARTALCTDGHAGSLDPHACRLAVASEDQPTELWQRDPVRRLATRCVAAPGPAHRPGEQESSRSTPTPLRRARTEQPVGLWARVARRRQTKCLTDSGNRPARRHERDRGAPTTPSSLQTALGREVVDGGEMLVFANTKQDCPGLTQS